MKPTSFYPIAFHNALRNGGGVILTEDMPWTAKSARNRFYGFLGAIRATAGHPLKPQAELAWTVTASEHALTISRRPINQRSQPRAELGADAAKVLKILLDEGASGA